MRLAWSCFYIEFKNLTTSMIRYVIVTDISLNMPFLPIR
jgi:hypothetical protein